MLTLSENNVFVFDLDDTLYSELEFESSGIKFVHNSLNIPLKNNVFVNNNWIQNLIADSNEQLTKDHILKLYRNHIPNITLYDDAKYFLEKLRLRGIEMHLITDGRSITQRNKIRALDIEKYFNKIIISEEINSNKPSELNFKTVMSLLDNKNYIYIGDNINKDFITPKSLGWTTICKLDSGFNIHKQNFNLSKEFLPQHIIKSFDEITL